MKNLFTKIPLDCRENQRFSRNNETVQPFNRSTIQRVKAYAFTLAETLIVIGIIGVVAALTLPNLNHATGDKEKVTKVKKIYSSLTDAVDRAQVIYGDFDTWFQDIEEEDDIQKNERFAKRVTEFMKISKDCGVGDGCISQAPLLVNNSEYEDDYLKSLKNKKAYMVQLPDGMSLVFFYKYHIARIKVDIDGPNKGKNMYGSDIFDFSIYPEDNVALNHGVNKNQLYPAARPLCWTGSWREVENSCGLSSYVTAWVIQNGNLDYLKCPDDLNWDTQTSCK